MAKTAIVLGLFAGEPRCITASSSGRSGYTIKKHCVVTKTLLVMKLTVILLTVGFLNVSAKGISQNVTFSGERVSLKDVFSSVERQTGFIFAYPKSVLQNSRPVSINANNVPLKQFLIDLFDSQPMSFQIKGKNIFISSKSLAPTVVIAENIPYSPIRGRVLDDDGQPLSGASVSVKNSKTSTVTDSEGRFTLNVNEGDIIIVSFVGYQSKNLKATPPMFGGENSLIIILSKISTELDETVVIAYGKTTKRFNTGNATTITFADFENTPVKNPILALQGRVPGMDIQPANGLPGAGVTLRVQGANSLINGNDPLIIVDGVPYPSQYSTGLGLNILGSNGGTDYSQVGSPLSNLNPKDIESISVLKGADATSIYGSRAANGAILITTKRGRIGKMSISFNYQAGISNIGKKMPMLNAKEYLSMRHEALTNSNITSPGNNDYDLNGLWDTTIYHDWQKELIGRNAFNNIANISMFGGNENTQYKISGTYFKQGYVFPTKYNALYNSQGSGSVSITSSTPNKRFKANFITNYTNTDDNLPSSNYIDAALYLSPVAPSLLTQDGKLNWQENSAGMESWSNPLIANLNIYKSTTKNIVSSLNLSYKVLADLTVSTNFGYYNTSRDEELLQLMASISPYRANLVNVPNSITIQNRYVSNWNIEPQINYIKRFNKQSIKALIGATLYNSQAEGRAYRAQKFNTDKLIEDISSAGELVNLSSDNTIYKYSAFFGRLIYDYKEKYILQLTGRRDGSSRFGSKNQFHSFGSVGAAWLISEEPFARNNLKFLNYAKLRSSYGTSGNDQIDDYKFLTLYKSRSMARTYQGLLSLYPTNISNPYFQWEEVKKWELGIELGFFKNRISLNANYNVNISDNQLLAYALPIMTGFNSVLKNLSAAKVRNNALEVYLSTVNIKKSDIQWSSRFTLTLPKAKLLAFPGLEQSSYSYNYVIGKSPNIVKVFKSAGVNDTTGNFQFYDGKGNLTSNPDGLADNMLIMDMTPKLYGSISNDISYKNITLSVSFNFDRRFKAVSYPNMPGMLDSKGLANLPSYMQDRWRKEGDNASYQRINVDYSNFLEYIYYISISDRAYQDVFYIRCNNISLSWELPIQWKQSLHMEQFNLYTQLMNPFVISNDNLLLDPQTGNGFPPLKTYNIGVKATF